MAQFLNSDWVVDLARNKVLSGVSDNVGDFDELMQVLLNMGTTDVTKITQLKTVNLLEGGGKEIERAILYDDFDATGWYEGREELNTDDNRITQMAKTSMKSGYVSLSIDKKTMRIIQGDEKRIKDHMELKMKVGMITAVNTITDALFLYDDLLVGALNGSLNGLGQLVGRTVSTVLKGGIDRSWMNIDSSESGNEFWDSNAVNVSKTTAMLLDPTHQYYLPKVLDAAISSAKYGGHKVSIIVMPEAIGNILREIQRAHLHMTTDGNKDLGIVTLRHQGIPIIEPNSCPAYHIYGLQTKPAFQMGGETPVTGIKFARVMDTIKGIPKPMPFQLGQWVKPFNAMVWVSQLDWDCNLYCDNPRLNFMEGRIAES